MKFLKYDPYPVKWRGYKNIDLKDRTLTIEHTKNRQRHVSPLSDYLYALMLRRQALSQHASSDYLFPAESETGHLKGV